MRKNVNVFAILFTFVAKTFLHSKLFLLSRH